MSKQMRKAAQLAEAGTQRPIKASAMTGATLNAGNGVTIWSKKVPADKLYAHGFGSDDRNRGRTSFIYADLVASGDGTGTADDPIEGELVAVITDSEQRDVLARYEIGDLETLADAADQERTERPTHPVLGPAAREDRHLELRIVADDASDGVVLDPDASSARTYYTDIAR